MWRQKAILGPGAPDALLNFFYVGMPTALLRLARNHAIDLDCLARLCIRVGDEHRRSTAKPRTRLGPADVLPGPLRTVGLDHPHGLSLVEGAVGYVCRSYHMGDPGLEPGTSSLSEKRSNHLS